MEKITFWRKPYNEEDMFDSDLTMYLTSATFEIENRIDTTEFRIHLSDPGMFSKFGEFSIFKNGMHWQRDGSEDVDVNFLRLNIIAALMILKY